MKNLALDAIFCIRPSGLTGYKTGEMLRCLPGLQTGSVKKPPDGYRELLEMTLY